ncbi:MAG: hypothetical protein IPL65_16045 [Lewinellaceae bacterium]|nr:hypothetical protein [Lewinellaceae bacterium]
MKKILLLSLISLAFLFGACKPAYLLSLKDGLKAGDHLRYRSTEETETLVTADEGEQTTYETKVTEYDYTIKSVLPDGTLKMGMKITRLKQVQNQNGKVTEYDSELPVTDSSEVQGRIFRHLIGQDFDMELTPQGTVQNFTGMNEMWDKVSASFSDIPMIGVMLAGIKTQFSDENMGRQSGEIWNFFPSKAIRVGNKWEKKNTGSGFKLNQTTQYVLKSRDAQSARVDFTRKMYNDPKDPGTMDLGMFKISYVLAGTGSGSIQLDQPHALVRSITQNLEMSGTMTVKISGMANQKLPITVKSKTIMERM